MSNPTTITSEPGVPFVETIREFDAPVDAVYRAHVEPELLAKWLGPRRDAVKGIEYDTRVGGRWSFGAASSDGYEFTFSGVFHTVEPQKLLIMTFEFSGAPGQVGIGATTFEDLGGRTRISIHDVYPSVEARDMAVASGMDSGVIEGYERLDDLLAG
ncbi:SRPBCC family protein [Arthrobacter cavernae]|uniref:SRPBCC family protein n=1 Tax=Arthrobacter cavernae TaxID=2817681 RepID=A0A939HIA7_9MICC|nr:SRPBCC family protein [Arthrobacter cavernae]MBO1268346.1 SRPBCC family protein [Arthrobacter cavernae]